jgi:glutamate synthase domain-containing protein 3
MTGGTIVILGPTGHNFGAGMTNGNAFVYDPEGAFPGRINGESVLLEPVSNEVDSRELHELIERHVAATSSRHAQALLDDWFNAQHAFWKVIPRAAFSIRSAEEVETAKAEPSRGVAD